MPIFSSIVSHFTSTPPPVPSIPPMPTTLPIEIELDPDSIHVPKRTRIKSFFKDVFHVNKGIEDMSSILPIVSSYSDISSASSSFSDEEPTCGWATASSFLPPRVDDTIANHQKTYKTTKKSNSTFDLFDRQDPADAKPTDPSNPTASPLDQNQSVSLPLNSETSKPASFGASIAPDVASLIVAAIDSSNVAFHKNVTAITKMPKVLASIDSANPTTESLESCEKAKPSVENQQVSGNCIDIASGNTLEKFNSKEKESDLQVNVASPKVADPKSKTSAKDKKKKKKRTKITIKFHRKGESGNTIVDTWCVGDKEPPTTPENMILDPETCSPLDYICQKRERGTHRAKMLNKINSIASTICHPLTVRSSNDTPVPVSDQLLEISEHTQCFYVQTKSDLANMGKRDANGNIITPDMDIIDQCFPIPSKENKDPLPLFLNQENVIDGSVSKHNVFESKTELIGEFKNAVSLECSNSCLADENLNISRLGPDPAVGHSKNQGTVEKAFYIPMDPVTLQKTKCFKKLSALKPIPEDNDSEPEIESPSFILEDMLEDSSNEPIEKGSCEDILSAVDVATEKNQKIKDALQRKAKDFGCSLTVDQTPILRKRGVPAEKCTFSSPEKCKPSLSTPKKSTFDITDIWTTKKESFAEDNEGIAKSFAEAIISSRSRKNSPVKKDDSFEIVHLKQFPMIQPPTSPFIVLEELPEPKSTPISSKKLSPEVMCEVYKGQLFPGEDDGLYHTLQKTCISDDDEPFDSPIDRLETGEDLEMFNKPIFKSKGIIGWNCEEPTPKRFIFETPIIPEPAEHMSIVYSDDSDASPIPLSEKPILPSKPEFDLSKPILTEEIIETRMLGKYTDDERSLIDSFKDFDGQRSSTNNDNETSSSQSVFDSGRYCQGSCSANFAESVYSISYPSKPPVPAKMIDANPFFQPNFKFEEVKSESEKDESAAAPNYPAATPYVYDPLPFQMEDPVPDIDLENGLGFPFDEAPWDFRFTDPAPEDNSSVESSTSTTEIPSPCSCNKSFDKDGYSADCSDNISFDSNQNSTPVTYRSDSFRLRFAALDADDDSYLSDSESSFVSPEPVEESVSVVAPIPMVVNSLQDDKSDKQAESSQVSFECIPQETSEHEEEPPSSNGSMQSCFVPLDKYQDPNAPPGNFLPLKKVQGRPKTPKHTNTVPENEFDDESDTESNLSLSDDMTLCLTEDIEKALNKNPPQSNSDTVSTMPLPRIRPRQRRRRPKTSNQRDIPLANFEDRPDFEERCRKSKKSSGTSAARALAAKGTDKRGEAPWMQPTEISLPIFRKPKTESLRILCRGVYEGLLDEVQLVENAREDYTDSDSSDDEMNPLASQFFEVYDPTVPKQQKTKTPAKKFTLRFKSSLKLLMYDGTRRSDYMLVRSEKERMEKEARRKAIVQSYSLALQEQGGSTSSCDNEAGSLSSHLTSPIGSAGSNVSSSTNTPPVFKSILKAKHSRWYQHERILVKKSDQLSCVMFGRLLEIFYVKRALTNAILPRIREVQLKRWYRLNHCHLLEEIPDINMDDCMNHMVSAGQQLQVSA